VQERFPQGDDSDKVGEDSGIKNMEKDRVAEPDRFRIGVSFLSSVTNPIAQLIIKLLELSSMRIRNQLAIDGSVAIFRISIKSGNFKRCIPM